jgi:hypothetical protein
MSVVTQEQLSKAVDAAVKIAGERRKLALQPPIFDLDHIRTPWWIVGRVIRDKFPLDDAHQISEEITKAVRVDGVTLQPTTIKIDKDILVGFVEKYGGQLPVPDLVAGPGMLGR